MEIDWNSLMNAAKDGVWNVVFGATGVCVFALFVSRVELLFQNASLKSTTIVYKGARIRRGLVEMAVALVGLGAALAALESATGGAGIVDSFSKALAETGAAQRPLAYAAGAAAILFDLGAFIFLMSEQRQGVR